MSAAVDTREAMQSETRTMALAGIVARVFNAGVVFLTQVLFARMMGASEFGVYATANTLMLLVAAFATLGLVAMPQRFWPEYEGAGDGARLRGLARFASWGPFAIGSVFALGGALLAVLARDLISPQVATATCIAMLTVPAMASLDVVEGIALTKAWKGLAYGVAFVLRPLIVPLVFLGAWLAGVSPHATLSMASLVAATWLAALLLLILVRRKIGTTLPKGSVITEHRRWIMAGLPVMLIDGVFILMTSTDVVLLSVFHDDLEVGAYSAAARLVALVAFVHHGITWASGHHFSALYTAGNHAELAAYAAKTTRWTFLPSVAAAILMALAAPLFLMLFGKDFEGGGIITAVLLLGLLARAAVGPAEQLLVMTDNQIACAYAYGWAFVVNIGFCLVLVPAYGGVGAALSTACGYAAATLIIAREVKMRLGFSVHIFALMRKHATAATHG
jgi:O-antigen/teichoic acid export membrane protein